MKYCPFCGVGLQDEMAFCPKCGKKFQKAIIENSIDTQALNDFATEMQNDNKVSSEEKIEGIFENTHTSGISKNNKVFLIAIVLVIVAAVAFCVMSSRSVDVSGIATSVLYLEVYDDYDNIVATASGFIVRDEKTLVTNYHVIENAYRIVAYTSDGSSSVDVNTVLAYDEQQDIAILQCDSSIGVPLLSIGDSDAVKQGDEVYAIGYPLGLANTVSNGVVSSRYIENTVDYIQVTAAISGGSSGGVLIDKTGCVVGVICASYEEGQNLNLAVASNTVSWILQKANQSILLSDIYESTNPVATLPGYTSVTVEELYTNPYAYDGELVAVCAWNAFFYYIEPTYAEHFYKIFLVDDNKMFPEEVQVDWVDSNGNVIDVGSFKMYTYYQKYIEPDGVAYITAKIYDSDIRQKLSEIETQMVVYGRFTYNPEYNEGGFITDPARNQIEVFQYEVLN